MPTSGRCAAEARASRSRRARELAVRRRQRIERGAAPPAAPRDGRATARRFCSTHDTVSSSGTTSRQQVARRRCSRSRRARARPVSVHAARSARTSPCRSSARSGGARRRARALRPQRARSVSAPSLRPPGPGRAPDEHLVHGRAARDLLAPARRPPGGCARCGERRAQVVRARAATSARRRCGRAAAPARRAARARAAAGRARAARRPRTRRGRQVERRPASQRARARS